jgi:uncharacterized protein YfaQ (DUF2300 family)
MTKAIRIRQKAEQLRLHLLQQQALLDAQLADTGMADPIRRVTGQSSLEHAIESTTKMIRSLDRVLHEHVPPLVTTVQGLSRMKQWNASA